MEANLAKFSKCYSGAFSASGGVVGAYGCVWWCFRPV